LTWYIPLLSLNGILEAFHASSATPEQVKRQAKFMIASSAGFASTLWFLTNTKTNTDSNTTLGLDLASLTTEQSLIVASCAAMVLRIGYAYIHARRFAASRKQELSLKAVLPHFSVMGLGVVSGLMLRVLAKSDRWQTSWKGWAELVGTGGILGLTTLAVM
jgi:oligosaccharide translocation protein RFT1